MIRIPRDTILTSEETENFVKGQAKLRTLRLYGLKALRTGYWSNNLIFALNNYTMSPRATSVGKETHRAFFDNQGNPHRDLQDRDPQEPKGSGLSCRSEQGPYQPEGVYPPGGNTLQVERFRKYRAREEKKRTVLVA